MPPYYTLLFLAALTIVAVMMLQCGSCQPPPSEESYVSELSVQDRVFLNHIIDPPPQFNTYELQTYATSLQTHGNWGRGCECNFSPPSDGRGLNMTGYF